MKNDNKFGDVPFKYNQVIQRTLEDNLLVDAGRQHELKPLSFIEKLAVKAYQRAINKFSDDQVRNRPNSGEEE